MDINITLIGMDAVDRLLDRLLPEQGADGEDVERIERERWTAEAAVDSLKKAVKKAAGKIPPEEGDEKMEQKNHKTTDSIPFSWVPEEGETYLFLDCVYGIPHKEVWRNSRMDRMRIRMHNVFQTFREAYEFADSVEDRR